MKRIRILIFITLLINTAILQAIQIDFIDDNNNIVKSLPLSPTQLELLQQESTYFKELPPEMLAQPTLRLKTDLFHPNTFEKMLVLLGLNTTALQQALDKTPAGILFHLIRIADFLDIKKLKTIALSKQKIKQFAAYMIEDEDKLAQLNVTANDTMCPATSLYPMTIKKSLILQTNEPYTSASWSSNGQYIAVITAPDENSDNDISVTHIWNVATGQREHILAYPSRIDVRSISWSPNNKYIAIAGTNEQVRVIIVSNGKLVHTLKHSITVISVAWSPNGTYIVTTSLDGKIRIWDTTTWKIVRTLESHTDQLYSALWSADSQHLVTTSADGTARIWNATTGQQEHIVSNGKNRILAAWFSPDGKHLGATLEDGTACIWDITTGQRKNIITIPGFRIHEISWSPDSKHLAIAIFYKIAFILNAANGQIECTLVGHTQNVNSIAWSPDSAHVVTTSNDKTARIWPIPLAPDYMNLAELLISVALLDGAIVNREIVEMLFGNTIDMLLTINEVTSLRINARSIQLLQQVKNDRSGKKRASSSDKLINKEAKKKKIMEED